jgi:TnpA family transposase
MTLVTMAPTFLCSPYRSLGDKSESIVCFSDPKKFKDCLIKPHKKFNEKLILSEEDNIQHILASLLMGETKQSNIITKLSSQQFSSWTKRALWEMNAALMSDHLLNYIFDLLYRQSIQGALGRGEAYHPFCRVRSYISTCRKHEISVPEALKMLFLGEIPAFMR